MSQRLKIAILGSRGFPSTYGGYETLVRRLGRHWSAHGHDVTVYCRERPEGRRQLAIDGVRCLWTPGRDTKAASTLSYGLTSHIDASLRGFDAALVLNIANGFYLPLLAARNIPTVLNTDGLEWERGKWGSIARRVFYGGALMSARFSDLLISDSEAIADVWEETFNVRPRFIPYGADIPTAVGRRLIEGLGLQHGSYVLSVARLIPENNVDLTLDALDLLNGSHKAVIVGSANYTSETESRLRRLNDAGKILWLGHVHDQDLLAELWANCGAYVHGHSVGGTNPALLQALGFGAPTLALDTPFNREVIRRDAQLFSKDPARLARMIATVTSDTKLQRSWADHGQATVRSRYNWADVCDGYEQALRDARATRRASRRRPRP